MVVLPIVHRAFRWGSLAAIVLLSFVLPTRAYPFDWDALWSNSNQRASQALEQGSPEQAAELFSDPQWKAAAQYRAEQFDQAVTSLENIETPEALYNKGNALARSGRFPDAIEAYETALGLDDTLEDAQYNRAIIQDFLEQQQRQQDGQGDENDDQEPAGNESDEEQQSSQEPSDQQGDRQQQDSASANADAGNEPPDPQDGQEETQGDRDEAQQEQAGLDEESDDPSDQTLADAREDLESQQAYEQWLRRIPDDPGGLLRRKFLYQYQQRPQQPTENKPW